MLPIRRRIQKKKERKKGAYVRTYNIYVRTYDIHLSKGSLDGELGRVAGVHPADEGVDEPLESFRAKMPRDEFLDALLVVGGRGQH